MIVAILGMFIVPQGFAGMAWGQATSSAEIPQVADVEDMAGMPCCPPEQPSAPDCWKACPLATLCFAKLMPAIMPVPAPVGRVVLADEVLPGNDIVPVTLSPPPLPRPPEA